MASSTFHKFNQFVEDLGHEQHLFDTDTLKILLTDTAPNAADLTVDDTNHATCQLDSTSNALEIAAASGYVKGGGTLTSVVFAQSSGTAKLYAAAYEWTAGASIGPFRYAVLYNASGGAAGARPL